MVLFSVEAALQKFYLDGSNKSGTQAAVAIYFLFAFWYLLTVEPAAYVYGPEIWPTPLRNHGAMISYFAFFIGSIWTSASAPQGLDRLGWKYYMIFIAATAPCVLALHFLLPEVNSTLLKELNSPYIY